VNRLSPVAGRRQRRYWIGHGRAHIEVRDVHRLENVDLARRMEDELARLNGVDWAEVNVVLGRVVVGRRGPPVVAVIVCSRLI
jgi:cation-transporting ATPase I